MQNKQTHKNIPIKYAQKPKFIDERTHQNYIAPVSLQTTSDKQRIKSSLQ